jgi:hypothetical protein
MHQIDHDANRNLCWPAQNEESIVVDFAKQSVSTAQMAAYKRKSLHRSGCGYGAP